MTTAVQLAQSVAPGVSLGFKNRIINGGMTIDQRNAGASVTPTSASYTLDRWGVYCSAASKFTVQQNAGSVAPPAGFTKYAGVTSSSAYSIGASEIFGIAQAIEGYNLADLNWGSANAKTVTLSFWVRSSLTGQFGGFLKNGGLTVGGSSDRFYQFSYTISSANTWEYKTVTILGDTTGAWDSTNGPGLSVAFSLGAGSSVTGGSAAWGSTFYNQPSGSTNLVATNGATFYITGVQLEVGTAATSFEFRDYGRELLMCQRYYVKYSAASASYASLAMVNWFSTVRALGMVYLPVSMRTTPSFNNNLYQLWYGPTPMGVPTTVNISPSTLAASGVPAIELDITLSSGSGVAGGAGQFKAVNDTTSYVQFSAEL